ncbi:MAG TPA: hypothetical protein VFS40_13795 [Gemmatimonadales bacterium]|nr:hypothetical protein [Gemmatimonadales bacterium]
MPKSSSPDAGPLPVAEQVSLLPLLEEAIVLGARLAAYGEPPAALGGHVQSLLPRAALAAPSIYAPASRHRTLGIATLRLALQAGHDEASGHGWTRAAEARTALATHRAAERAHALHTGLLEALVGR